MPLTDQIRIARERTQPRIVQLWQALAPLKTVVSFMNTGAHPDDETSAMLAAMSFRDGIDLSYACSTRGEGGQNDIGTEATETLGVLRTAEMERACDVLNLRMYWLSVSPEDSIFDFGFSKSGVETMGKWGRARTLARFVDILRTEKPDIICPTFLDIPGQHGHHRAMTEAAHLVMDLAADPAFPDSSLPPWQVSKMYLPAWSGAGQAYDDDLPPPPTTLTVSADGVDSVTGWSYERIAQQSRAFHQTQAMGRWVPTGSERNWPLHLAVSHVSGPDETVFSGLPQTLADLGYADCQAHIDAALSAFPDFPAVLQNASKALAILQKAEPDAQIAHKIDRKISQLSRVIRIAAGAELHVQLNKDHLQPTDTATVIEEFRHGQADEASISYRLPEGWTIKDTEVQLSEAALSDPYPHTYLPHQPAAPCAVLKLVKNGIQSTTDIPFELCPLVLPKRSVTLSPLSDVINLRNPRRDITLSLSDIAPSGATPAATLPSDWQAAQTDTGMQLTAPAAVAAGRHSIALTLDGQAAQTAQLINHPHIEPRAFVRPAEVQVQVVDCAVPDVKVGYIGGGNDRVDHWLDRLGVDVTALSDDDLQSDSALAKYDSILIGIFAMKFRKGLAEQMPRLHRWTEAGGTLVTLYHRPWDNWDQDRIPPRRLEVGQPSLRWRVTDENAEVTALSDHPLLTTPNKISAADWAGWHKERGIYFAKSWSNDYTPVLEMADPDEQAHRGALLCADIGKGRHVHCALILHHQMEKLVPGGFRLMANLLAKRT